MKQTTVKTSCIIKNTEWIKDVTQEKYCAYCGQEFGKQIKEKCKYKV
jgi:hypothetical protein